MAIAAGKCRRRPDHAGRAPATEAWPPVLAGNGPRRSPSRLRIPVRVDGPVTQYALAAQRHMHEYGTTSAQLAWIKVAASHHAQSQPQRVLPKAVTVEEVRQLARSIADPLHLLDCCVITDGGGAWSWSARGGQDAQASAVRARPARRPSTPTTAASTSPHRRPSGRGLAPSRRPVSPRRTSTTPPSTTPSPSPCSRPSRTSGSAPRATAGTSSRTAG